MSGFAEPIEGLVLSVGYAFWASCVFMTFRLHRAFIRFLRREWHWDPLDAQAELTLFFTFLVLDAVIPAQLGVYRLLNHW